MYLRIIIEMDNDAFAPDGYAAGAEVARILRDYSNHLQGSAGFDRSFRDINGQTVGNALLIDADYPSKVADVNSEDPAPYKVEPKTNKHDDEIVAQARRILLGRLIQPEGYITEPGNARDYAVLKLSECKNEVFAVMWLDNRHGVLAYEELFFGTIDGATVPPRPVVQRALEVNAAACVLIHNHPSQNAEPSNADERITHRLRDALALVDVRVLDHIVVGGAETVSLAERGLL